MIVIWQRMRRAVTGIGDTEWALLAFETLGVVLGIVLAFQLNAWNSARIEARYQHDLLERLHAEAQQNVASLRALRDQMAGWDANHQAIMSAWIGEGTCPDEGQLRQLGTVQFFPSLQYNTAAYDEMIGSGGLASIADPRLREAISHFHSMAGSYRDQQDYFRSLAIAREAHVSQAIGGRAAYNAESGQFYQTGMDMARICGDGQLQLYYTSATRNFGVMQGFRTQVTERAIAMCAQLGRAVGRDCLPSDGAALEGADLQVANAALAGDENRGS